MKKKILVVPFNGATPRMATVTGVTWTGKLKAEDRYGNKFKVTMR